MGVRTRGLNIKAGAAKLKADRAARIEAELVLCPPRAMFDGTIDNESYAPEKLHALVAQTGPVPRARIK